MQMCRIEHGLALISDKLLQFCKIEIQLRYMIKPNKGAIPLTDVLFVTSK